MASPFNVTSTDTSIYTSVSGTVPGTLIGLILFLQIIRDKATGMSQGFAFIEYERHDSAASVISAWNGKPSPFADPQTGTWRIYWSKREERQMPHPSAA
jgi:hypothetical protein